MEHFDLVIANGTVVTAETVCLADVGIIGEEIVAIGRGLRGRRSLDAAGCYVLPGAVDVHVHLQMPVSDGRFVSSDDFATGTVAAAHGGTTTVIDFVEPKPGQSLLDALAVRRAEADSHVAIDYGLHMTIPAWHADRSTGSRQGQPEALAEIPAVMEAGLPTFKLYLAYRGLRLDDAQLYAVLSALAAHGALPIPPTEPCPSPTARTARSATNCELRRWPRATLHRAITPSPAHPARRPRLSAGRWTSPLWPVRRCTSCTSPAPRHWSVSLPPSAAASQPLARPVHSTSP